MSMANEEDRISARRRIETHRQNLRQLEERAATYAGDVPLHIVNQIAQERANIAILEPIATAGPSAQVQQFVTQVSRSNGGDLAMLMSQFALLNARMTKAEEQNQTIIDEQGLIRGEQSRASVWRMQTDDWKNRVETQVNQSERSRNTGAVWYRRAITIAISMAVLALIVGCAALAVAIQ